MVITSLMTENCLLRVEVAPVLAAVAVTASDVRAEVRTGVPTICTVFDDTLDRDKPVPLKAGAEKVIAFPDPAYAVNCRGLL
jgi:hypothetical protein